MTPDYKGIYKQIKKHKDIVVARHIAPDPDAIASQISLRDSIRETFPDKNVYAVGVGVSRFKYYGYLDKLKEEELNNPLLIVLDTPNISRIDGVTYEKYKDVIKIDHHPFEDKMGDIEFIEDDASSTCQLIIELLFNTKLKINKKVAENLFMGVVSDCDRFLLSYTSLKTFKLITKLIEESNIDFLPLYDKLYERSINEFKFKGYIANNINITENGLGYIRISKNVFEEYEVDPATASNLINDFNYIKEMNVWIFIVYDEKNNLYKLNIRSRGPIVNEIASHYNGGGHKLASGIRTPLESDIDKVIKELDEVCKLYKEKNNENN